MAPSSAALPRLLAVVGASFAAVVAVIVALVRSRRAVRFPVSGPGPRRRARGDDDPTSGP